MIEASAIEKICGHGILYATSTTEEVQLTPTANSSREGRLAGPVLYTPDKTSVAWTRRS